MQRIWMFMRDISLKLGIADVIRLDFKLGFLAYEVSIFVQTCRLGVWRLTD